MRDACRGRGRERDEEKEDKRKIRDLKGGQKQIGEAWSKSVTLAANKPATALLGL